MSFALNTKIDVFLDDDDDGSWYIVSIVDINKNELKIHYDIDGDNDEDDEWINKTSDRLAALHTYTLQCVSLPDPPIEAYDGDTSCVYYQHQHRYYILLCIHELFAIHRYNIMDSKWEHFCDYPQQFKPYTFGQISIDPLNLILYIMALSHAKYAKLDIVSREWTVHQTTNKMLNLPQWNVAFIFISFPTKSLYFQIVFDMTIGHIYQIIDNQENDATPSVNHVTHNLSEDKYHAVIWCQELSKIIVVHHHKIFHCNINDNKELKNLKWKQYGFQLDMTQTYECRLIIGYKHILFVFSSDFDEIYCVDLLYEQIYKSHKSSVQINYGPIIVKGNGDYIYSIDCGFGTTQRISLLDIFPNDLICFYKNKIGNPLIFGYISEFNKKNQLSDFVPFDIANLILNFYPLFLESC